MRAAGLEPLEPYPGSAFPWKRRCTGCGAIVSPRLGSMTGKNRPGCKLCGNRRAEWLRTGHGPHDIERPPTQGYTGQETA